MSDGRKNNGGTKGNKGGRKSKADEQKLIERLSPLDDIAFKILKEQIEDSQSWAIKLFFSYRYGMPKQMIDVQSNENVFIPIPIVLPNGKTLDEYTKD
jgi:hypothetical protein